MPEPKSKFLFVKVEPWQHRTITEAAAVLNQSVSEFVRLVMLAAAARRLGVEPSTHDADA